jgi:hypothetical protein
MKVFLAMVRSWRSIFGTRNSERGEKEGKRYCDINTDRPHPKGRVRTSFSRPTKYEPGEHGFVGIVLESSLGAAERGDGAGRVGLKECVRVGKTGAGGKKRRRLAQYGPFRRPIRT